MFTFWSLYLYDRELVYPKLLDNFIPQWLNHGMVRLDCGAGLWGEGVIQDPPTVVENL